MSRWDLSETPLASRAFVAIEKADPYTADLRGKARCNLVELREQLDSRPIGALLKDILVRHGQCHRHGCRNESAGWRYTPCDVLSCLISRWNRGWHTQ